MLSQTYANYTIVPSANEFSLSKLGLPIIHCIVNWWLLWCLLSAFTFPCGCYAHQWGLNCCGLWCHKFMDHTLGRHMFLPVMVCGQGQACTKQLLLLLLWVGGSFMLLIQLSPSHSIYMVGHKACWTEQRVTWFPYLPYMAGRGFPFPVMFHPMTW